MQLVGARFGHQAHRAAGFYAVLRVLRAGLYLEFLQRIRKRQRHVEAVVGVVVQRAVEQIGDAKGLAAGNRDAAARRHAAAAAGARVGRSAGERNQRHRATAFKRQRIDLFSGDCRANRGVARLDQRRRRFDRNGLLEAAQLHLHEDDRIAADLEDDAGLREGAESRQRGFDAIGTGRQIQQGVRTGFVRHRLATEAGLRLDGDHGNTREHRAA